ncbi:MAG: hypothetical protein K6G50_05370 [bacterium]|nr:hypothetical protein [bacterium]
MICENCGSEMNGSPSCPHCGADAEEGDSEPKKSGSKCLIIALCGCGLLVLFIVGFFAILFIPGSGSGGGNGKAIACRANLKNIGVALEMYAADNGGLYPPDLKHLVNSASGENYLRLIPECPAAGKDTYSASYKHGTGPDRYLVYCSGRNHEDAGMEENAPAMASKTGLHETGVSYLIDSFDLNIEPKPSATPDASSQESEEEEEEE